MTRLPGVRVSGPEGLLPGKPSTRAVPADIQPRGRGPYRRRGPIRLRRPRRRDHQRRHPRRRREQGLDLPRSPGRQVDPGCDVRGHDRADPWRGGRGDGRRAEDERARRGSPGRRVRSIPSPHERDDDRGHDRRPRPIPLSAAVRRDVFLRDGAAEGLQQAPRRGLQPDRDHPRRSARLRGAADRAGGRRDGPRSGARRDR